MVEPSNGGLAPVKKPAGKSHRPRRAQGAPRDLESELAEAQAIAHVGNWVWDVDKDEVRWSDELYRIYGLERGSVEIDYATFLAHVVPEDRDRIDRIVNDTLASGEQFDCLHGIVRPDGNVRTIHARGRVIRDDSGRPIRMLGTGQDVTEIVKVERELRQSGESYRMLAENVQELIIRFTPAGRITYASPAALTILGYNPAEVIGREGREFLHPEDIERVTAAHCDLLHGMEPPAVLSRLLHRDGHPVWMETTTRAVRDPQDGRVMSIVAVSRDVTESVRAARVSRLFHELAATANEAVSARDAMKAALKLICEHTGWPVGHVYLPSVNAPGEIGSADIWHLARPELQAHFRDISQSIVLQEGQGQPGKVMKTGRAEWILDVTKDPGFIRKPLARRLGARSALASPVRSGDRTIAVLEFFTEQPQEPDRETIDLLDNLGSQLGEVLQRKRAEKALRASEERFRALAESANDAIVTIDEHGRIVHCNPSFERIFGFFCEEMGGQLISRILPELGYGGENHDLTWFMNIAQRHPTGSTTIETTGRRKDGEVFPVEMSLAAWDTTEGSFATGILRDVTSRKRAEEALEEKVQELARSNSELALFTYIASHDLREPLRTVGSHLQLVRRKMPGELDGDTRKQIDFAMSGVRRMQSLIDDLLVYSRVGTEGRVFEQLASGEAVQEAIQALSAAIEESGGSVAVGVLPRVTGDKSQLVQLFQNLLSNAVKFHGDSPPRIEVGAERKEDCWEFTVRDHGIGIDPQYADHVFTIFQRLHTAEEYPGTGIGLAVCRKIVERHGGRIWMDPAPDGGSVFRFTLPARGT